MSVWLPENDKLCRKRAVNAANGLSTRQAGCQRGKRADNAASGLTTRQAGCQRGKRAVNAANGLSTRQTGCQRGKRAVNMANAGEKPCITWQAANLDKEWRLFKQCCEFTFKSPLATNPEGQKVNYLMTYISDKGREIYETFTWTPATDDGPAEDATVQDVYNKYAQYEAPMKNRIRATVTFNRRIQDPREKFDNYVTDLRIPLPLRLKKASEDLPVHLPGDPVRISQYFCLGIQ